MLLAIMLCLQSEPKVLKPEPEKVVIIEKVQIPAKVLNKWKKANKKCQHCKRPLWVCVEEDDVKKCQKIYKAQTGG